MTDDKESGIIEERKFASQALLEKHYNKHSLEFDGITQKEYLQKANELANEGLLEDVKQLERSDGSISKYKFSTNEFVVPEDDGNIRTYFFPKKRCCLLGGRT